MHVLQTLQFINIVVATQEPNAQVNVQLENSTFLRITVNYWSRFYKFKKPVTWEGSLVKVTRFGDIDVVIMKNETGIWNCSNAIETLYEGIRPHRIPDFYHSRVIGKQDLGPMATVLHLRLEKDVFLHINPGHFIRVKQTLDGRERRLLYTPVPYLPIKNKSYPNPDPDRWWYGNRPINLLVNKRRSRLNTWLAERKIGDRVIIGNPEGKFKPTRMKEARHIFLAANGAGVAPLVSIALWTLQTTSHCRVYLGIINEKEEQHFWRDELQSICNVDRRFHLSYALAKVNQSAPDPTKNWILEIDVIENLFPREAETKYLFYCIAGGHAFNTMMMEYINITYQLPFDRMFVFEDVPDMLKEPSVSPFSPDIGSMDYPDIKHDELVYPGFYRRSVTAPYFKDSFYNKTKKPEESKTMKA